MPCSPSSEAGIIPKKRRFCVQLSGNGITSRLALFANVIIMETEFLYAFLDSLCEVNDGVLISKTDCRKMGNYTKKITNTVFTGSD